MIQASSRLQVCPANPKKLKQCCSTFIPNFTGKPEVTFDILIHILILSVILEIVFEKFLQSIERKALTNEISKVIESAMSKIDTEKAKPYVPIIRPWFCNNEDTSVINSQVVDRNRLFIFSIALACVGYYTTFASSCKARNTKDGLRQTLMNNAALLAVVGVIEGLFVSQVMLKYIPTKPSLMETTVLNRLKSNFDDSPSEILAFCYH